MPKLKKVLSMIYKGLLIRKSVFIPELLACIILIGLITYRLIEYDTLRENNKKNISYSEIPISFVASWKYFASFIFILIMFGSMLLSGLIHGYKGIRETFSLVALLGGFVLVMFIALLLSPIGLTIIRVSLQDNITRKYDIGLSVTTVLSSLYVIYVILRESYKTGVTLS